MTADERYLIRYLETDYGDSVGIVRHYAYHSDAQFTKEDIKRNLEQALADLDANNWGKAADKVALAYALCSINIDKESE